MTGIERLRKLSETEMSLGYAGESAVLKSIADQIELDVSAGIAPYDYRLVRRTQAIRSVLRDMERYVSGVEGMEDSPVARWARELRDALGGHVEEVTDVATVRKDAYDAYEWVEANGGLDAVKEEWQSRVPRDRYERRRQRLLDHIAECETALGRRNRRIEELGHRVNDLTTENAELRRRAMPEGMEWPRFEGGEPVRIGDQFAEHGGCENVADSVEIGDCWFKIHGFDGAAPRYSKGASVKRPAPKVLDADGAEIEVGDDLYSVEGMLKFHVSAIDRKSGGIATEAMFALDKWADPKMYTHRAPVLAADGEPLREGEHVYHVETGAELVVKWLPKPVEYQAVVVFAPPASHLTSFDPDQLTHERPDSWERIEGDIERGKTYTDEAVLDIVRRAKALAGDA